MARSKCTPALIKKIVPLIRKGATIDAACKACNIDRTTHYAWLKYAKDPTKKNHIKYKELTEKALAEYETELLEQIQIHSSKQWQAAAWILERRFRGKFGKEADQQDADEVREDIKVDDKFL